MTKNRFYSEFTYQEINYGNNFMMSEMMNLDFMHPVRSLHMKAWQHFKDNKFSYDGATFVRERSNETIFELASFIHDWLNSNGYVGKKIDDMFIDIMITLNYPRELIIKRYFLMRMFTWVNVLRHKYILKDYNKELPDYYYSLPEIFINPLY